MSKKKPTKKDIDELIVALGSFKASVVNLKDAIPRMVNEFNESIRSGKNKPRDPLADAW